MPGKNALSIKRKSLFLLAVSSLMITCLSGACTKKYSVAPKAVDLPTLTPTPTVTATVTTSFTASNTPTITATFTPTRTPTPLGPVIVTIAGTLNSGYAGDGGPAVAAELSVPCGMAFDSVGNLYFCDSWNNVVRKIDTAGIITTVAGNGTCGCSGDGGPATAAQLYVPCGLAIDALDNLYIADLNSVIRKVDTSGIITTIAGNGDWAYYGDGGPATSAALFFPTGLMFDSYGNLYIADSENNVVRKVDTSGIITTVAGNGVEGYSGDGGLATAARLHTPYGLAFDALGNLYIAEYGNNTVRKVDTGGIITTVAGTGNYTGGYSGDGGPATSAELDSPEAVAFDASGDLYIADTLNDVIRKVDTGGIITTVVGSGISGYSGDGGPPLAAKLTGPTMIIFDASGDLYIADTYNSRIRKVY